MVAICLEGVLAFAGGEEAGLEALRRSTGLTWRRASGGQVCAASACDRFTYSLERTPHGRVRALCELTVIEEGTLRECTAAIRENHRRKQRRPRPAGGD